MPVTEGGEETPSALVTLSGFQCFHAEETRTERAILQYRGIDGGDMPSMPINARSLPGPPFTAVALRCILARPFQRAASNEGKSEA